MDLGMSDLTQIGTLVSMVVTAVWAVSRIKNTTDRLAFSMEHLRETVNRLDTRFETIASELSHLRERATRLEVRLDSIDVGAKDV